MYMTPKPGPQLLGPTTVHPIEHAEETELEAHEDELVGATPHIASEDRRPEEPSDESDGLTDLG